MKHEPFLRYERTPNRLGLYSRAGLKAGMLLISLCRCNSDGTESLVTIKQSIEDSGGATTLGSGAGSSNIAGFSAGGATTLGSGAGSSSTTGGSSAAVVPVSPSARFSELKIDPPSTDGNNEFIEIEASPATLLDGYWLVVIEGDIESNLGQIDKVVDLSKCSGAPCRVGSNGLLLLIAAEGAVASGEPETSISVVSGLVRGGLENGTGYIGLFSGPGIPSVGADWDSNDDGILELPTVSKLQDAISWTDGDDGDGLYATTKLGSKPLAQAAIRCGTESFTTAWRFGQLLGDATSLLPDLAHWVPTNLDTEVLTPGGPNPCFLPVVTTNTTSSSGGTSTVGSSAFGGSGSGGAGAPNVNASGGSGSRTSTSVTASAGASSLPSTIVIKGSVSTGGSLGFWAPSPFASDGGSGGVSAEVDGGSGGVDESTSTSPEQPRVPGGCSIVAPRALTSTSLTCVLMGIFSCFRIFRRRYFNPGR